MNLAHKFGSGIPPQQFIDGMTKNQSSFLSWQERFTWDNNQEDEAYFRSLRDCTIRALILCTDWCPDVITNVPVLFAVLEHSRIPTEVLIMEQHLETMDQFLTDGGRAQPILILTDENGNLLGKWGPRPQYIQEVMNEFRRNNPDREAADYQDKIKVVRSQISRLYSEGTGYQSVILKELRELISSFPNP